MAFPRKDQPDEAACGSSHGNAERVLLPRRLGLVAGRDFTATFSGKNDNSIMGVANRDYDAAAIANSVLHMAIVRSDRSRKNQRWSSLTNPSVRATAARS